LTAWLPVKENGLKMLDLKKHTTIWKALKGIALEIYVDLLFVKIL
jgi:hypothetical protein